MLLSLNIKNLSLIKSISLDFSKNFNVITGETGSGKSVLLDCISSTLGGKNNRAITSEDKGSITLEFDISGNKQAQEILKNAEIDFEDRIIIRKSITSNKSQIFLNDEPVSQNLVRSLAEYLIESYRQNDFTGLLDKKNHIEILDNFANIAEEKLFLTKIFRNLKDVQAQIESLQNSFAEREKEKDFLEHAINELKNFSPEKGEEELLIEKRTKLSNKKRILEIISVANNSLEELQISRNLLQVQKSISKLTNYFEESRIHEILNKLEKSITESDDAEKLITNIFDEVSNEENNLDEIEERLFTLREFSRKYSVPSDELPELIENFKTKLSGLKNNDDELRQLQKQEKEIINKYLELAERISKTRIKSAEKLEKEVNKEFPVLNLKGAKFAIEINSDEKKFSANGFDEIIFKVATNPGQALAELAKVASGGEISRVMLALKIALSDIKSSACLIFDEIDTGIGGATADLVGERIKKLGKNQQVICITHSQQISAKADSHILVAKITGKNKAEITAKKLSKKESDEEIARMIAGVDVTKEARAAAVKLKG